MARKIDLTFSATTSNITTSLNAVLAKLKLINKQVDMMNKRNLKVQVDDKGLDGLSAKAKVAKVEIDKLSNSNDRLKKASNGAAKSMMGLGASMLAMIALRRSITVFSDLSKDVFTLGTVSQLTTGQIGDLRKSLIEMSDITSASALANAIEELVRTGRGLEESTEIISKVAKLAIASGEELGKTSGVIQKIMVALNMEASQTGEILNILHSTSLNTATSMAQLAVAFKQAGGALGVFSTLTSKSGQELKDYKIDLLSVGAASIGVFQNMGRSASQAGIHLRMLTTKLVKFQNTAKRLIDQKLLENAVSIDPKTLEKVHKGTVGALQLTADKISEIATENLPKAVALMGDLYNDGILNLSDILTGFTIRHGAFIANLFAQMGSGYEELVEKITTGRDYLEDYETQSKSLYNQIERLKNEFIKLGEAIESGSAIEDGVKMFTAFVKVLRGAGSEGENAAASVARIGIEMAILGKLLTPVVKGIAGLSKASLVATLLNPLTLTIGALTTIGVLLYEQNRSIRKTKENYENTRETIDLMAKKLEVANDELALMAGRSEKTEKTIRDLADLKLDGLFGQAIGDAESLYKEASDVYEILTKIEAIRFKKTFEVGSELKEYTEGIEKAKKELLDNQRVIVENKKEIQKLKQIQFIDPDTGEEGTSAQYKKAKQIVAQKIADIHVANAKILEEGTELRIKLEEVRTDYNNKELKNQTEHALKLANIIDLQNSKILKGNRELLEAMPAKTIGEFVSRYTEGLSIGEGKIEDVNSALTKSLQLLMKNNGKIDFSSQSIQKYASEYLNLITTRAHLEKALQSEDIREGEKDFIRKAIAGNEILIKQSLVRISVKEKNNDKTKEETEYIINLVNVKSKQLEMEQKIAMIGLEGVKKADTEYKYALLILQAKEKEAKILLSKKSEQFGIGLDTTTLLSRKSQIEGMGDLKGKEGKKLQAEYKHIIELLKLQNELEEIGLGFIKAKSELINENQKLNEKFAKSQGTLITQMYNLNKAARQEGMLKSDILKDELARKKVAFDYYNAMEVGVRTQEESKKMLELELEMKIAGLDIVKEERAEREAMLSSMIQLGGVLNTLSGQTGIGILGQAGGILGGLGGIGQGVTQFQEAGTGLQGALGMAGGIGTAVSAGIGILKGIFDKPAEDFAKQNQEQKSLYSDNTSALQELTNSMGQVQGGVRNLSDSLISSIANIPTLEKIMSGGSIIDTILERMLGTREFGSASFMEEKTHSGSKGFLGIGSQPGSTEYNQYTESAEQLWGQLMGGDMMTASMDELSNFANRLDVLNKGVEDNYSVMADLIRAYVDGINEMEKVSGGFALAINLQSMQGIEYLDKEQYLKQYEDLYDQLGVTMTGEIRDELEAMWRESPSMVTVTQDMRASFMEVFKDGGISMGDAFASTIGDYMGAFTTNLAQIMFDTTFGSQIEKLEDSFLSAMTSLSELKMEGEKVTTDMISELVKPSLEEAFEIMNSAREEGEMFDEVLRQITETGLEMGYTFSELAEAGILDGTSKGLYNTLLGGLVGDESMIDNVMDEISSKIVDSFAKQSIDEMLGKEILKMSTSLNLALAEGDISDLGALSQKALELGMMAEAERSKLSAIKDLFDYNSDTEYTSENQNITYQTGTTSAITNNYYLTSKVEAGVVVSDTSTLEELVENTLDILVERLKVDKGIDLNSI